MALFGRQHAGNVTWSACAGTSVLGYLILLGLLLLHCAVLALVLAPSQVICGVRRLLPALAYAVIFAAMFLKVNPLVLYNLFQARVKNRFPL